ncbi:MAG: D-tyrosyl-tRNA deacylase [candidate division Zixibacteria bacterium RBG_16_48_11]|nr:MAG: D-tyrosyl-tRNA deacylase [candidate division Zixibacteria bacterium RBG_16_48_11]
MTESVKKFDLNIEKVLEDWEVYHAIREVIANALDEQVLTKTKDIEIVKDRKGIWHIRDFGRGLKYQHLTQKENEEKLKNEHLIGKFGVGLKDALATFDRRKIKVSIKTRYGDISLAKSQKHEFEDIITLHACVAPPSEKGFFGTEFILVGCKSEDIEKAKSLFLKFSGDKLIESNEYGEVLKRTGKPARIYVNGVKVAEEDNFLFSYNITSITKSIKKAFNRERTNVGRTAYTDRVKSILLTCKSKDVAHSLVEDLKEWDSDLIHDELRWTDVAIHACRLLNSLERVIFLTPEELVTAPDMVNLAKADGYAVVTIPENIRESITGLKDISGNPIRDLSQFKTDWNKSFQFSFVDPKELGLEERKVFDQTEKVFKLIGGKPKKVREIKISETMRMETFAYREAAGLWEESTGRIIIKRSQLCSLRDYAGTLLHEVGHAQSGARDISEDFEQKLTEMLGLMAAANLE